MIITLVNTQRSNTYTSILFAKENLTTARIQPRIFLVY